jgi:glycerol-3-phosphate dehydrogenase
MFAIPWHDHALIGTTDTPITQVSLEPVPMEQEIDFILETASRYLEKPPGRADVLSVWAGIRPLVKSGAAGSTAALSRDHSIHVSQSGLLTIAGGKWTTYRRMAEDCVDHAATLGKLPERPCVTESLHIHGYHQSAEQFGELRYYGSDATGIRALAQKDAALAQPLHPSLPVIAAQVVWAVRNEMARTVDDVLARRTRSLLLNAQAAIDTSTKAAKLMAKELKKDARWQKKQVEGFRAIAQNYLLKGISPSGSGR